jgi:hypothetical protein
MGKTADPVPFSLEKQVPFHIPRVSVPILSPVVSILFHPALLGVTLVIAVVRVIFDLSALPLPFPDTLAFLLAAISLGLYPGIGKKKPAAVGVGTSDLLAHGPPSRRKP